MRLIYKQFIIMILTFMQFIKKLTILTFIIYPWLLLRYIPLLCYRLISCDCLFCCRSFLEKLDDNTTTTS